MQVTVSRKQTPDPDPDVRRLGTTSANASDRCGSRISEPDTTRNRGPGELVVARNRLDELDGILTDIR